MATRCVILRLAVGVALASNLGCGSRDDPERSLKPADTPGEEETGGPGTEFYFKVIFLGGRNGGEVFIATTNERVDVSHYAPGPRPEGGVLMARRDVFLISSEVATEMDRVLNEAKFFQFPSMWDAFRTDGVSWRVVVKSRSGARTVVVSESADHEFIPDFRMREQQEIAPEDDAVVTHAKRVFNLVRQIRDIANQKGRRLY